MDQPLFHNRIHRLLWHMEKTFFKAGHAAKKKKKTGGPVSVIRNTSFDVS